MGYFSFSGLWANPSCCCRRLGALSLHKKPPEPATDGVLGRPGEERPKKERKVLFALLLLLLRQEKKRKRNFKKVDGGGRGVGGGGGGGGGGLGVGSK